MGLDMYAYMTRETPARPVDFEIEDASPFYYWRKHPDLHGWMEELYREKGGEEQFNCVPVQLTASDLDRLEADIRSGDLPDTTGFFFGDSDGTETAGDLAFIAAARVALAEGYTIYYNSWW